ncbi:MAG: DUF4261 domain-containing protein [Planctomycetes bacterium]|nr:DUF4261 domain-containing protein [Planctomycetota bacterium]MCB9936336.1 DUF4261 domain-containing protein [Planctomycetota bacterium]
MALFDWLKRGKPKPAPVRAPAMIVLLDALPEIDPAQAARGLAAIEPLRVAPRIELERGDGMLKGLAEFDAHCIGIAGTRAPVPPEVMKTTVEVSSWTGEGRELLESHAARLVLTHHGGGAPILEKYIALYKLAAVLGGEHLRGVLIEDAWTCAPPALVREFTSAEMLKAFRESTPPILFTGFVKFHTDDGTWFATKGQHMFNAPDLVMFGPEEQPSEVMELFMNIFLYVTGSKARIAAGHTLQIAEEAYLKFSELAPDNPWREWLQGAEETLELKRINKEEINRK